MMHLHIKLLVYLDKTRILTNMKNKCEDFLNLFNLTTVNQFQPLRYCLELDVMELLDLFPELGDNLIKEPLKFRRYCNYILYACVKTAENEMREHVQESQIAVNIRLKNFPHVLSSQMLRLYAGIFSFKGLLVNISKVTNYVYHTVWSCPEQCDGNEVILQYMPKTPPRCHLCKSTLFENGGLRRCGDQVEATFQFKNYFLPKKCTITDDLIPMLKLGTSYFINATMVAKKTTAVWSLQESATYPAPHTLRIPSDIQELFEACNRNPWKFIYCISSCLGLRVCPFNCFMNVKINLLLSLTSVKARQMCGSSALNCLVAGHDTGHVAELMRDACDLANPCVMLGPSNSSVASALIQASGGVCVMPLPLQVYSQKQIYSIVTAIETGEILADKVKLNSAVWAHGMDLKKIVLYDVARVFGTVSRGDYGEYSDEIVDFKLQEATEPREITLQEKQRLNDISVYIDLVGGIKVSIHEDAQYLLSSYFVAARREKNRAVTVGSMESLVTICATSARLCCRSVATIDDAVFAIWLHVSGMPQPRFAPDDYLDTPNDIDKLDNIINKFQQWLENFTDFHIYK